jgi:hypothetical protein
VNTPFLSNKNNFVLVFGLPTQEYINVENNTIEYDYFLSVLHKTCAQCPTDGFSFYFDKSKGTLMPY